MKKLEKLLTNQTVTGELIESIKGPNTAIRIDKESVQWLLKVIEEEK